VGLERGPLGQVSINKELLEKRSSGSGLENRLTAVGDQPRSPLDTPLSTKVGTKFRQQVAVVQSVQFAFRLKATEFVFVLNTS
jgi:hypothetical protein